MRYLLLLFSVFANTCTQTGGLCKDTTQCPLSANTIITGICPGAANIKCCFPDSQPNRDPKDVNGKVVEAPRVAVVDLNTNMLFYYENKVLVRKWNVGTGSSPDKTPPGNYKIYAKDPCPRYTVVQPPIECFDRDPKNPLGRRALWYKGDIGLHGTNRPDLINDRTTPLQRRLSKGCVRNHNDHIVWLYERMKIGDPVIVIGLK
jgi:hypothetical protein